MDFDKQKMVIQEIDELIELEKYDEAKKKLNNLYVEEEKRLIHIILELDPNNVKAMTSAKRIARKEGDIEAEKIFIQRLLKLEPNNLRNIIRRKVIA